MTATKRQNHGIRKVCGCRRRAWAKCSHPWHFSFKWKATHHRFSLDKHLGIHIDNKTDAETAAENIRGSIKAGTFGQPAPREDMTLRQLADAYLERYVRIDKARREPAFTWALNTICRTEIPRPTGGSAPFGEWRLTDIVTDTIERFREVRRTAGVGAVGVNRNLQSLRALWNWAVRAGYVTESPFKRHGEAVVKISKTVEVKRTRRLNPETDEESALLAVCHHHLRAVVECALQTGMRRGEILSLVWSQITGMKVEKTTVTWAPQATIFLPSSKTKTTQDRWIPISTRLKAILELRRFDPDGQPLAEDHYVFGNEIGQQVASVTRAWMAAVLKSHGHKPTYTKTANLSAQSRAAFEAIDLHFHDLRRECGSRWLEGGVPLHIIRDWLGHSNITQTSTYLAGTIQTQHDTMRQFEDRRAALQPFATGSKTGGRKRLRTAGRRDTKPNKTAVGRNATIM